MGTWHEHLDRRSTAGLAYHEAGMFTYAEERRRSERRRRASRNGIMGQMAMQEIDQGWHNTEMVNIIGYSGPAQDAQLSPDGRVLIFDSHNDSGAPSWLYWAKTIDYKTFQFMGKIDGVNLGDEQVRGNLDRTGNFYFASKGYQSEYGGARVGCGVFKDGKVTNVEPCLSLEDEALPEGYFLLDGMTTPNGYALYYNVFTYVRDLGLQAQIKIALKNADGSLTKMPNSDEIMQNVNAVGTVYGAQPSDDGFSLYFTLGNLKPIAGCKILFASRNCVLDPFGLPRIVKGVNDVYGGQSMNEGGSLSPDGKHLYFHRVLDQRFSALFVVSR